MTLKYELITLSPGIFTIENFITVEEQNTLLLLASKALESDWYANNTSEDDPWFGKNLSLDVTSDIVQNINDRLFSLFSDYGPSNKFSHIHRFKKNQSVGHHSDRNHTSPLTDYGIVLYLNDDYEGGELRYVDRSITIKPKARSLIVHSGDIAHVGLPVLNDKVRYFMTAFMNSHPNSKVTFNQESVN